MRVALVTLYPTDMNAIGGGIRMVSYHLVQGLKAYADLDLIVVHCHSDIHRDWTARDGDVEVRYLGLSRARLLPNLTRTIGRIREALRDIQPDVVHANAGNQGYAAALAGYPTVYTFHGLLPLERKVYTDTLYDRMRYGVLSYYEKRALPRMRRLVALSDETRRVYPGFPEDRWIRINNPVPERFFQNESEPVQGRILFAGSITEVKDLMTLLRAVDALRQRMPAASLRIAGRVTSPAYAARIEQFVRDRGLEEHVSFLGLLGAEELLAEYAGCSVVALSSVRENSPMTLIEAMAAARPVVATRVGGVPELVTDGEQGLLVSAGDHQAMAAALERVLSDPAMASCMGARGRERARAGYSLESVARAYHDLYTEVLDA